MRKILTFLLLLFILPCTDIKSQETQSNDYLVNLTRMFAKDIFETNGVPYLQPMVEAMNATSNSGFYNQAFIPKKVDKPYFKVHLNGMFGFVPDNKKTYSPYLPNEELTYEKLMSGGYISLENIMSGQITIQDTAGLIYAVFLGMMYDGKQNNSFANLPTVAATLLGGKGSAFNLGEGTLEQLMKDLTVKDVPIVGDVKIYNYLSDDMKASLDSIVNQFPTSFPLPDGADISTLAAGVPQFEIGSYMGTELLIRFIPKINMGENVGDFMFWGFGLKHSISQYFNNGDKPYERYFDLAVQAVYQGTTLENKVGVTEAELKADATMWDFNIHGSKHIEGWFDIYTGISLELININSTYTYEIPWEQQVQLGLIDPHGNGNTEGSNRDPSPGYPGDTAPQTAEIELDDSNIKWSIGLYRQFGPVGIFLDYNVSTFNLFSGGLEYRF